MTADVYQLGPHIKMTVEEALALCHRECEEYSEVLILAVHKETKGFIAVSSEMINKDVLWLCELGKNSALGLMDEGDDDD